jgi:type II secretory pathway component PulK
MPLAALRAFPDRVATPRRALILPVVLVMIGLLALTMAGYIYFVRAEIAGVRATGDAQQARLAAESGLEEVIALLRLHPQDRTVWYDNPQRFRHALIWAETYDRESDPVREARSRKEWLAEQARRVPAWRYSVAGMRLDSTAETMRFGITPESAKLDLNEASGQQIRDLLTPLLVGLQVENPDQLVNALLDWKDEDADARDGGAENEYYNTLQPPYNAKNGRLDTVEELLLVKGFNAAVLYGEDVNRNGILDQNENDGDASAPYYDNADGVLNPGLAPFVTIWSIDVDRASDDRPRINLNDSVERITEQMEKYFAEGQLSETTQASILAIKSAVGNFQNYPSAASLFVIPGGDDTEDSNAAGGDAGGDPNSTGSGGVGGGGGSSRDGDKDQDRSKAAARQQDRGDTGGAQQDAGGRRGGVNPLPGGRRGGQRLGGRGASGGDADQGGPGGGRQGGARGGGGGGGQQGLQTITVTAEELPILLDYFSTRSGEDRMQKKGLINVNTAPARVLALIPGLPPKAVEAILQVREGLGPEKLRSIAWLRTEGILSDREFQNVAPAITSSAYQYTVEIFAYADHTNSTARLEWVLDLVGMAPQVRYHRDLTRLGPGWPVDSETVIVSGQ